MLSNHDVATGLQSNRGLVTECFKQVAWTLHFIGCLTIDYVVFYLDQTSKEQE